MNNQQYNELCALPISTLLDEPVSVLEAFVSFRGDVTCRTRVVTASLDLVERSEDDEFFYDLSKMPTAIGTTGEFL